MTALTIASLFLAVLGTCTAFGVLKEPPVDSDVLGEIQPMLGQIMKCNNLNAKEQKDFREKISYGNDIAVLKCGDDKFCVTGTIIVTERVTGPLLLEMTVDKCPDETDCQTVMVHKTDGCEQLEKKEGPLFDMMSHTKANTNCPLEPGNYTVKDWKVDISQEDCRGAYIVAHKWSAVIKAYENNILTMCSMADCEFAQDGGNKKSYGFDMSRK